MGAFRAGGRVREAGSDGWGEWLRHVDRQWLRLTLAFWAALACWYLVQRWNAVHWLILTDTDDNMRLLQVRAWLDGQGWYDLRQYRMDPPRGFDMHWSRVVDLPLAGLILFFRAFTTDQWAERLACGIAPLLPLSVTLVALAATVRRLVGANAWILALAIVPVTNVLIGQFVPMRVDHHGWQLACLAVTVAGLCDPKPVRGGSMVGAATALSLSIGLELLPYAAMAGAITALRWVWDRAEGPRMRAYAWSLGLGSLLGFALFASEANRVMRCDALTPVWLSAVVVAGALLLAIGRLDPPSRAVRLALAAGAGAVVAAGFAILFPQCLTRPEQVSDELARIWLNNVREAKPIYRHPLRTALPIVALPLMGLLGAPFAAWEARRTERAVGWAAVALFTAFACAMLLWQARAGPSAQMLAIPGAVALAWAVLPEIARLKPWPVAALAGAALFALMSGWGARQALAFLPAGKPNARAQAVNRAGARCGALPALRTLDAYPAQTVFTHSDLGPRLLATTHHRAVAGPYHRNGPAILDVHHAFRGSPAQARAIMRRHGATLLLLCPNIAESTVYRAKAPGGFYDRLAKGERFGWLRPLALPKGSPFRLYRVR